MEDSKQRKIAKYFSQYHYIGELIKYLFSSKLLELIKV